jgi:hypothetical protein
MDIELLNVELCENSGGERAYLLALDVTDPATKTTTRTCTIVPTDVLEWRIAEYGLDDLSDDDVWELVIREALTPLPKPGEADNVVLSETVADARKTYVGRINAHKGKGVLKRRGKAELPGRRKAGPPPEPVKAAGPDLTVIADSDGSDGIELLKARSPRRPEHIEARRIIVERARRDAQAAQAARNHSTDDLIMTTARRILTEDNA